MSDIPEIVDPPEIEGVDVEYADPEPDETTGGDAVQLVATGWVRFVIAGHGRVRFRPARMGELRRILEAHDQMLAEVGENADRVRAESTGLDAEYRAVLDDPAADATAKARAGTKNRADARRVARVLNEFLEDARVGWWRTAHEVLGVSGESLPDNDQIPVWMLEPDLIELAIGHWRSVPLDRGRLPKQTP